MGQYFEFVKNDTITVEGHILHRIRCTRDCKWAKKGEFGGYIEKFENLFGNAWVSDNAQVYGDARVYGNARIDCIKAHCGFDVFGSYGRHTHAYITAENKIEITCGCFRGSIEEFEAKVRKTHGDNQYANEYLAIIYLIKIKFGLV